MTSYFYVFVYGGSSTRNDLLTKYVFKSYRPSRQAQCYFLDKNYPDHLQQKPSLSPPSTIALYLNLSSYVSTHLISFSRLSHLQSPLYPKGLAQYSINIC